ncbi:protoporphyrinogen oxidase [Schizosaccharomyces octosporus yFS286]|uniref:Protoporphyrinogen oxidase n=1 Tax=Schizosaccharomyces octosporus (strain yFS286) TaxID=483514 RepID=S9RFA2_SCHOY|nr:protoporphyrinogen oxidase [Schizosaccharomyces octosporus yFS286]EPX72759.1 protoporphyrinogen oxidase [Schizosaccharomyces octosporus yFS286]
MKVAICGGGIAGLSTAFYLSRLIPTCQIDLYERDSRLGGWLQSVNIPTATSPTGNVLFEQGPRTLRPSGLAGLATVDLLKQLKMEKSIKPILKDSSSAKNKYIYYPDRLNVVPSSGFQALKSVVQPAFRAVPYALLRDLFQKKKVGNEDESIGSFMERRFGKMFTHRLISSLINGIYAGNLYSLSMQSTMFGFLADIERKYRSVILGIVLASIRGEMLNEKQKLLKTSLLKNEHTNELFKSLRSSPMVSLEGGIESIISHLNADFSASSNVKVRFNQPVTRLALSASKDKIEVNNCQYDYSVFAMSSDSLSELLPCPAMNTPTTSVYVVNLFYQDASVLSYKGFGYLTPLHLPNNPNHILGVVFDSEQSNPEQGAKLTVMMGGHNYAKDPKSIPTTPEKAVSYATEAIKQSLGIYTSPDVANATLQRNCIPQYKVGHQHQLDNLQSWVDDNLRGRLHLTGSWYNGVSIGDCILNGYKTAQDIALKAQ